MVMMIFTSIYGPGFFTALGDGVTSAIVSFLRTTVFQAAAVLLLPLIWKIGRRLDVPCRGGIYGHGPEPGAFGGKEKQVSL